MLVVEEERGPKRGRNDDDADEMGGRAAGMCVCVYVGKRACVCRGKREERERVSE
jgi:hypothetical protein